MVIPTLPTGVLNGATIPDIELSVTPTRSVREAEATAVAQIKRKGMSASQSRLVVYREGLAKGVAGGTLFFACDDAYRTHADLVAKGVEITEEPVDQPYGIDFGLRDPFGNQLRIAQMTQG